MKKAMLFSWDWCADSKGNVRTVTATILDAAPTAYDVATSLQVVATTMGDVAGTAWYTSTYE